MGAGCRFEGHGADGALVENLAVRSLDVGLDGVHTPKYHRTAGTPRGQGNAVMSQGTSTPPTARASPGPGQSPAKWRQEGLRRPCVPGGLRRQSCSSRALSPLHGAHTGRSRAAAEQERRGSREASKGAGARKHDTSQRMGEYGDTWEERCGDLYPTRREKCRQASRRWVWKLACRKLPPHSGQTWGGRFLCMRWWALKLQRLGSIMGQVGHTYREGVDTR